MKLLENDTWIYVVLVAVLYAFGFHAGTEDLISAYVTKVPYMETVPTNVVTDLSTLYSDSVQFGLTVDHSYVSNDVPTSLVNVDYVVNTEADLCYMKRVCPNYTLCGYYNAGLDSGLFQIGAGAMYSEWTELFDTTAVYYYDFIRDSSDYELRLQYMQDALTKVMPYWTGAMAVGDNATVYTNTIHNFAGLLQPTVDATVESADITICAPEDSKDCFTVRYTYYFYDNELGVTEEYYEFKLSPDVDTVLEKPTRDIADGTTMFSKLYEYVMR